MNEDTRQPEPLLKPGQVAELFRVDVKTVARWAKAGKIDAIRTPGGQNRFRDSIPIMVRLRARARLMESNVWRRFSSPTSGSSHRQMSSSVHGGQCVMTGAQPHSRASMLQAEQESAERK